MRMRKKKNLIPRMERCAAVHVQDGFLLRGHWRDLLPGARELRVELGCGKGRFTVETAAAEPEVLFIAIERVADALVVAMERAVAAGLKKRVLCGGRRPPPSPTTSRRTEVDRVYINFCDPWPPKRQAKRPAHPPQLSPAVPAGAENGREIHFKTDNAPLFAFSLEEFPRRDTPSARSPTTSTPAAPAAS